jgi:hypothetical protein
MRAKDDLPPAQQDLGEQANLRQKPEKFHYRWSHTYSAQTSLSAFARRKHGQSDFVGYDGKEIGTSVRGDSTRVNWAAKLKQREF